MLVSLWSVATFSLFAIQYSWIAGEAGREARVKIQDGGLELCVLNGDEPFKKGSATYPRTEFRGLEEYGAPGETVRFAVNFTEVDAENLSYWQVFGSGPEVMIRVRNGVKQLVVFGGEPKIQTVAELPSECFVTCGDKRGRGAEVRCGEYVVPARIRCKSKLHLKFGPYLQHVDALEDICVKYNNVLYNVVS